MRYRWLSFALFFVFIIPVSAQLDSLRYAYQIAVNKNDRIKQGIHLSDIARYYFQLSSYDSALSYYSEALKVNRLVKNDTMIASNLNDFGNLYKIKGDLDSAGVNYSKALEMFKRLSYKLGMAYANINLAIIYKDKGLFEKALESGLEAEELLKPYPDNSNLDNCYNTLGSIYNKMQEYDDALIYYNKALLLRRKSGDRNAEASSLNNIGNVYSNMGDYEQALTNLLASFEIKKTSSNKKSIVTTLNNLGTVSLKLDRVADAEKYFKESLIIKRELNDKLGQVITLNNLANCKIITREYKQAEEYLNEASKLEKLVGGVLVERKNNLQARVTLNRALKNYSRASDYAEELLLVKDSLLNIEKAEALAEIQTRYETETKEQQIEVLSTEQELNRTALKAKNFWIAALVIAITLSLIIVVLVYISFRIARKGRQRVETLMKELHHRVKNNLQVLSSVLSLQSQHMTDENALLSVKSTEGRINAMALIHRKLYSDETNTIVSTRGYFRELIEYLASSYGFGENRLKLIVEIDEVELDVDKAIPLGLIANELISNVFKHAYVNQEKSELTIVLKQRDQQLDVIVKDNGKGFKPGSNSDEEKFGSRMVAILVKDIRGVYTVDSSNGTTHKLTIPLT